MRNFIDEGKSELLSDGRGGELLQTEQVLRLSRSKQPVDSGSQLFGGVLLLRRGLNQLHETEVGGGGPLAAAAEQQLTGSDLILDLFVDPI